MIHLLKQPATDDQIREMLELHESYIKVAVDIQKAILAGGGEFHADCEALLVEEGSEKKDVWGADWVPESKEVRFGSLINIRGKTNRGMDIHDTTVRGQVEQIVRKLLDT